MQMDVAWSGVGCGWVQMRDIKYMFFSKVMELVILIVVIGPKSGNIPKAIEI